MAQISKDAFNSWLKNQLTMHRIDRMVYLPYIIGILDSDEPNEDKQTELIEMLTNLLSHLDGSDIKQMVSNIVMHWEVEDNTADQAYKNNNDGKEANIRSSQLDERLTQLLTLNAAPSNSKQKEYTKEDRKIREAILSQYNGQVSDDDLCAVKSNDFATAPTDKNVNTALVLQAERLRRDQAKADSQKKKDKDKEDKMRQKEQRDEKKEKRKTQKQERRR